MAQGTASPGLLSLMQLSGYPVQGSPKAGIGWIPLTGQGSREVLFVLEA